MDMYCKALVLDSAYAARGIVSRIVTASRERIVPFRPATRHPYGTLQTHRFVA